LAKTALAPAATNVSWTRRLSVNVKPITPAPAASGEARPSLRRRSCRHPPIHHHDVRRHPSQVGHGALVALAEVSYAALEG